MDLLNRRYIQGAQFFGSSNVNVDDAPLPIESVQPMSNHAIINNLITPTSTTTFRAGVVGQGYKQVKLHLPALIPLLLLSEIHFLVFKYI